MPARTSISAPTGPATSTRPAYGYMTPVEDLEQRRLARPVERRSSPTRLARLDDEVDVPQRPPPARRRRPRMRARRSARARRGAASTGGRRGTASRCGRRGSSVRQHRRSRLQSLEQRSTDRGPGTMIAASRRSESRPTRGQAVQHRAPVAVDHRRERVDARVQRPDVARDHASWRTRPASRTGRAAG